MEKNLPKHYYKAIKTINSFDNKNSYIEYKSKGDKDKNLLPNEYLDMIRPYLWDMINDHKAPMRLKVYSGNKIIDSESQFGEWKIQLKMWIKSISSKNFKETRTMHSVSTNIEILMGNETKILLMNFLNLSYKNIKKQKKNREKGEANLFMKMLIYCIIIFIK